MPNYTRWKQEGATYFFTVVTAHRRPLFRDSICRRWLGDAFREGRRRFPFEIEAIVLLPDHLHVVMIPDRGVDYSQMWRLIKTAFTRRIGASNAVHQDTPYSEVR